MQDQLRRFTHRTDEQQDGNQVQQIPIAPQEGDRLTLQIRNGGKDVFKANAVRHHIQGKDAQGETKITYTVHNKGFNGSRVGGGLTIVKANQQI